jgi:hypothetical protein
VLQQAIRAATVEDFVRKFQLVYVAELVFERQIELLRTPHRLVEHSYAAIDARHTSCWPDCACQFAGIVPGATAHVKDPVARTHAKECEGVAFVGARPLRRAGGVQVCDT